MNNLIQILTAFKTLNKLVRDDISNYPIHSDIFFEADRGVIY